MPGAQPTPVATRMTGLRLGPLTTIDGYLRIGEGEASRLVVWPPDFEIIRKGDSIWVFYDGHEVEVRVGQAVSLGGGEIVSVDAFDERTGRQVPTGCPGPYWLVGNIGLAGKAMPSNPSEGLVGTKWTLISLNGERLIKGTEISLSFGEEHLGGAMTCGDYGGDSEGWGYRASDDGILTVFGPLALSFQGCSEPNSVINQGRTYVEALERSAAYRTALDGLQIADASGKVTLVFEHRE